MPAREQPGRTAAWLLAPVLWLGAPEGGSAQHFAVDDAPVVDTATCQVDAWHGRLAGWAVPACNLFGELEIAAGVGWIRDPGDEWSLDYVVQGKYGLRPLQPGGVGVSLVTGIGLGPAAQVMGRRFHEVFVYVPASVSTAGDRFVAHVNLGWSAELDGPAGEERALHAVVWGGRGDLSLSGGLMLIGEVFGTGRETPEYQLGFRAELLPGRLSMDVSYGDRLRDRSGATRIGLVVGLAWTSPSLF
jgi:hypothetical protein